MNGPCASELPTVEDTGVALEQATREILERMFFLEVEDVREAGETAEAPVGAEPLAVEIGFHGAPGGQLRVVLPERCARELAANFTGVPGPRQPGRPQTIEVMRELTNMICGTTLSRLAPQAVFDLDAPAVAESKATIGLPAVGLRLTSAEDWIDLYWHWKEGAP